MNSAVRSKLSQMNNLKKEVLLPVKAERVEMTLNTESAIASGLLIQRLTELYEDPIEASVRETISNALDATSEMVSGHKAVVKIMSPSALNPVLIIKDNGVGMTYEDLKNIYSKYGASTKVDNLEQIGAYGLGAKAPLAYGTEFTVTSVKAGQKTTIIVAREELTNYIKIVDSVLTDEPSGTTVSIPINNYDLSKFIDNIDKYKKLPIDKNVDLYIDGELQGVNKYILISDNVLILDSKEKVYGRVWINKEDVVNLMTDISKDDLKSSLKYLIGGWAYDSPSSRSRRYYRSKERGIIVELKAGIVGFNSSRDAILDNDRYSALEELAVNYVESKQFMTDLTKAINKMELIDFKEAMSKILDFQREWTKVSNGKVIVDNTSSYSGSYYAIPRKFKFEDLTHKETGFNINQLLKKIPIKSKPTVVIKESKSRHYKAATNSIMRTDFDRNSFCELNVSDLNSRVEEILEGDSEKSHSLEVLMMNLIIMVYNSKNANNLRLTFITDVKTEDHIKRLKSGRKAIVRMRNENKSEDSYNSVLIYTNHKKLDIEEMIVDLDLESLDISINPVEKTIEDIKKFRARNKTAIVKSKEALSTKLTKFNLETSQTVYSDIENFDKNKINFIVVNRDHYIDRNRIKMMHAWFCNHKDLNKDSVEMYVSCGVHTASDVKLLMELGEVYRDPISNEAGLSKAYREKIHHNVAQLNAIRNDSINTSEKAFVRLITGLYGYGPSQIANKISNKFENAYKIAELTGTVMPEYPTETIKALSNYEQTVFSEMDYYSRWLLEDSAIKHLITLVNKDQHMLLQDLTTILPNGRIVMNEAGDVKVVHYGNDIDIDIDTIKEVYDNENISSGFNKLTKLTVEAYLDFIKSTVKAFSKVNF